MYYKPDHFELYELVPKYAYQHIPHDYLWGLWDSRVLWTQEQLRLRYGKMVCNTWKWGGICQYRGYRPPRCKQGAIYSQHRFFGAIDSIPMEVTAEEIRQDIIQAKEGFCISYADQIFQHITCIEGNVGWLHFDSRNYNGLLVVYP